jgi:DNA processing protein
VPKRDLFAAAPIPASTLDDGERLACLRLIRSSQIGPATFRDLIAHFGSARSALQAIPAMSKRAGRPIRVCSEDDAEAELKAAARIGAQALFTIEPGYPAALAAIDAPPPLIYVKGRTELLAGPCLAIVGSRHASAAGMKVSRMFASELAASGFFIVSGLARGIDAAAHDASLGTGTIAVLAGGTDVVYPPEHGELQARIGEVGCLLTEQPSGFVPRAKDFPRRNRLISGLSLGVVVVEAARRSGTLVTARFAGEQGREVFAVPGHPLDPRAEGTNQLLKSGATIATQPQDVLDVLAPQLSQTRSGLTEAPAAGSHFGSTPTDRHSAQESASRRVEPGVGVEPGEQERDRLLAALGPNPIDIDEIVRVTELDAREVRVLLMELDLAGEISRHGAQLVSRAVE